MARETVPAEVSRKAAQMAVKALRERYAKEYAALVDMAYMEQGYKSPADRRREREEAAAAKKQVAAEKREQVRLRKIAEAKALLAAEGLLDEAEAEVA